MIKNRYGFAHLQEKSGSQPLDLIADFDNVPDNLNFFTTVSGTAPNMQYNDEDVDRLIARITDENIPSDLATNSVGIY
ncbi:putative GTP-binding EngB [Gossypium arboreum]|uniref:Putative GTP-binding EngB n=1 Tax=Gossypium arboreum TaxID=29729 RepID=A0A0B0NNG9_GOSAR|nr:putative GTP-binding EngB [Gossypium arboreum]